MSRWTNVGGVPVRLDEEQTIDIQVFDTTGLHTWTKPSGNFTTATIIAIGGGGGGGGGAQRNDSAGNAGSGRADRRPCGG